MVEGVVALASSKVLWRREEEELIEGKGVSNSGGSEGAGGGGCFSARDGSNAEV